MKKENAFTYNTKDGRAKGSFNIYQDREGALQLVMGNRSTRLAYSQIEALGINVYDLIDFNHSAFKAHYNIS